MPTGTVTFQDGSTILGSPTLTDGVATFITSTLAIGSHSITASYGGDPNDQVSTSNALTQVVNQDSTTTTLTVDNNPTVYGQAVTLTATVAVVSPGAGAPTGTVTFQEGSTILGSPTLTDGVATFITSTLAIGSHSITASYGGDPNDQVSTSNALTQVVNQDSTTTTLTVDNNPTVYGQAVTLTATVAVASPGAGAPTGTVTFQDGSTILGSPTLTDGVATFITSTLAIGSHSITASYGGEPNDQVSTSNALTQAVNQDSTTTTLKVDNNPTMYGQAVTLTATVAAVAPGAGHRPATPSPSTTA